MNKLEKIMITRLLEPKDVQDDGSEVRMQVGALKMIPRDFEPMLPLAEKCLTKLPGITGAALDAPGGQLAIRYDRQSLNGQDVVAWYRLVFREALNEADTTPPDKMTAENADAIAARAQQALR